MSGVSAALRCAILSPVVLTLGRSPEPLMVLLTPKADFTARLHCRNGTEDQPWPVDTVLALGIRIQGQPERRWTFEINGAVAELTVPEADVNQVIAQMGRAKALGRLWLEYTTNAQGEFLWASGPVQVLG